jgi:hypothetical protein
MGADLFGSYVATGSYGSWNYVIKDMGGRIDDAFGVWANFITNGNCWFWYPIFNYRNPVS